MAITSENVGKKSTRPKVKKEELKTGIITDKQFLPEENKKLLKMIRDNYSWTTPKGVVFTKEHPYQLVEIDEVLALKEEGFVEVEPEEMMNYYKLK